MKQYRVLSNFGFEDDDLGQDDWEIETDFDHLSDAKYWLSYEKSSFGAQKVEFKIQSREVSDWADETV